MTFTLTPAAGYLRVSSEKQGRDNRVSIPEQKRLIEQKAKQDGAEIVQWYADSKPYRSQNNRMVQPSGTRADRPGFVSLLADMAAHRWPVVYAWSQDRLGRGAAVTAQLRDVAEASKCEIRLVVGAWDADTAELLGAVSGMELRRIQQRMAMGRVGRFRKGLHHARPKDCYDIIRDAEGHSIGYQLTEAGRALLATIAQRIIAGDSYYDTARQVGRGESWVSSAVKSSFYRGQVRLNGELRQGNHEPAWGPEVIAALDREVARRRSWAQSRPRHKTDAHVNLFAGLLRCGYCGAWMKCNNQARGGRYWLGYACGRTYRRTAEHPPNTVLENVLIGRVREMIGRIDDSGLLGMFAGQPALPPQPDARVEHLRTQARELEQAMEAVKSMPLAARAIAADLDRVRADIEAAAVVQVIDTRQADEATLLAAIRTLRSEAWWEGDRTRAGGLLRAAIRELWVRSSEIVAPPHIV